MRYILLLFCFINFNFASASDEFFITQQDIESAKSQIKKTIFTKEQSKKVAQIEKRHFKNSAIFESDSYRLKRLEDYLLKENFHNESAQSRIERLELASQKEYFKGTSIPRSMMRSYRTKRINEISELDKADRETKKSTRISRYDKNDVGIIDGLLRLYAPDLFKDMSAVQQDMLYK